MFDLEQASTEWRERMKAAGIQAPVPLEELEIHLREEIEQRVKAGLKEQEAFHAAVWEIGQGAELKTEFLKAGGFSGWFGGDWTTRTQQILGALWMALGGWSLFSLFKIFGEDPHVLMGGNYIFIGTGLLIQNVAVVIGGMDLFRETNFGRTAIRMLAVLCILEICLRLAEIGWHQNMYQSGIFFYVMLWNIPVAAFSLITIWWLRAPPTIKASHV